MKIPTVQPKITSARLADGNIAYSGTLAALQQELDNLKDKGTFVSHAFRDNKYGVTQALLVIRPR